MGFVRFGAKAAILGSLLLVQALACSPSLATGGRSTPSTDEGAAPIFDPDAYGTPTPAPPPTSARDQLIKEIGEEAYQEAASIAADEIADLLQELGEAGELSEITRIGKYIALGVRAVTTTQVAIDTAKTYAQVDRQVTAGNLPGAATTVSEYAARTALTVLGLPLADRVVGAVVWAGNYHIGRLIDWSFDHGKYSRFK